MHHTPHLVLLRTHSLLILFAYFLCFLRHFRYDFTFEIDALGAWANAFTYADVCGLKLWMPLWRCLWSWKIGCLDLLHDERGQNFTRRLGAFFSPVIWASSLLCIFYIPCTSFWWRLRFLTLFQHFLQILKLLIGQLTLVAVEALLLAEVEHTPSLSVLFKLSMETWGKRKILKTGTKRLWR